MGSSIAIRTTMMPMTTSNSTSVNALAPRECRIPDLPSRMSTHSWNCGSRALGDNAAWLRLRAVQCAVAAPKRQPLIVTQARHLPTFEAVTRDNFAPPDEVRQIRLGGGIQVCQAKDVG